MPEPTITRQQLAVSLGVLGSLTDSLSAEQESILSRLQSAAEDVVKLTAPAAPVAVANEAVVRLVGYWFDTDPSESPRRTGGGNAMASSGAAQLLAKWRIQVLATPSNLDAPVAGGGGSTAALAALTARVAAVESALAGKANSPITDGDIPAGIARDSEVTAALAGKVDSPITDGDIPAGIARDSEVTAAIEKIPTLPVVAHSGRVLSSDSQRKPFWDMALAVVLRALGNLTGQAGKYLRIGNDEASIDLVDAPTSTGDGGAGVDAMARAGVSANRTAIQDADTARSALSQVVGMLRGLVDSIAQRTGQISGWTNALTDFTHGHFQIGYAEIGGDGQEAGNAPRRTSNVNPWVTAASEAGNRVPVMWAAVGIEPDTRRIIHARSGATVATYPRNGEYWRTYDSTSATLLQVRGHYQPYFLASETSDAPVAVALQDGDTLTLQIGEETEVVKVPSSALADALVKRLLPLPTVGNKGKFAAIKSDGSAWEVVDAPGGGSVGLGSRVVARAGKVTGDTGFIIDHPGEGRWMFVTAEIGDGPNIVCSVIVLPPSGSFSFSDTKGNGNLAGLFVADARASVGSGKLKVSLTSKTNMYSNWGYQLL